MQTEQIISQMELIASLSKIEIGKISLYHPPRIDDIDPLDRYCWDMYVGESPTRHGGRVVFHIYDEAKDVVTALTRNFVHNMIRTVFPSGLYEALAERAYIHALKPENQPRESVKNLLSDLILCHASRVINRQVGFSDDPEGTVSATEIFSEVLSQGEIGAMIKDIGYERERAIARRKLELEEEAETELLRQETPDASD